MKLVNVADFGIKGINYYWAKREMFNLSENELASVGVTGNEALVDISLIPNLIKANNLFRQYGYEIIVKDAYRSIELYNLVRKKRYIIDGKKNTDKTLSIDTMPHSSGLSIDVNLIDLNTGKEVEIWDKKDWPDGIFVGYYQSKTDPKSKKYQELQDILISNMQKSGFKLGSKSEIHHFTMR